MLVHPQFDPIAIHLGPLAIRWYGLMYLIGFITLWLLGRRRIKTQPWSGFTAKQLEDLIFYGVLGVVLGGRLGYVLFYKPEYYFAHPLEIFAVWQGGMAFHGDFLGVLAAAWWFGRRNGRVFADYGFCRTAGTRSVGAPDDWAISSTANCPGATDVPTGYGVPASGQWWSGTPRSSTRWGWRASACS
jgi:hypothetical protein